MSPKPAGFVGVDKETCAVVVIDITGDPETSPVKDLIMPVAANAARICEAARQAGVPVIFADDAHLPGLDHELELWGPHGLAGQPESLPAPQLRRSEADFLIEKRRYSAFFQTGLRLLLTELGVKTLICVGLDTNICVRHTIADAYFNDYGIIVARDATCTFLVGNQIDGLDYLQKCYAARIAGTDEIVAFLG